MDLKTFLKDRRGSLTVQIITISIVVVTAALLSRNTAFTSVIASVLLAGICIALFIDYLPRRTYYNELLETAESLARRNLMVEVTAEPTYEEGRVVHGLLRTANKAMLDEIAEYWAREQEYREYIELWIHEIKTPISSAKLIAHNSHSSAMDNLYGELERVEDLVEQTLFYARSTSVEKDFLVRETDLTAVVHPVLRRNARAFIDRHIALETDGLELLVYTDVKWASFIVSQILANAIAYTPEARPSIRIAARRVDRTAVLTITDNGCGILPEDLPRVFERGFTGANGRRNAHATGLGLYLVHTLAEQIEVSVAIDSAVGNGTTVSLTFPAR